MNGQQGRNAGIVTISNQEAEEDQPSAAGISMTHLGISQPVIDSR